MRTEILELWDRSKHDIGIYKEEWRKMRDAAAYAAATDAYAYAAYAAYAYAAYAADAADADYWFKRADKKMEALR